MHSPRTETNTYFFRVSSLLPLLKKYTYQLKYELYLQRNLSTVTQKHTVPHRYNLRVDRDEY